MLALGKNFLCNVLFIKNSTLDICGSMIWRKQSHLYQGRTSGRA